MPVATYAYCLGLHHWCYLDDWLVLASSYLLALWWSIGLQFNLDTSDLLLGIVLGMRIDTILKLVHHS